MHQTTRLTGYIRLFFEPEPYAPISIAEAAHKTHGHSQEFAVGRDRTREGPKFEAEGRQRGREVVTSPNQNSLQRPRAGKSSATITTFKAHLKTELFSAAYDMV